MATTPTTSRAIALEINGEAVEREVPASRLLVHLGFDEETVTGWLRKAGLKHARYRRLRPDTTAKGPGLFVATASR